MIPKSFCAIRLAPKISLYIYVYIVSAKPKFQASFQKYWIIFYLFYAMSAWEFFWTDILYNVQQRITPYSIFLPFCSNRLKFGREISQVYYLFIIHKMPNGLWLSLTVAKTPTLQIVCVINQWSKCYTWSSAFVGITSFWRAFWGSCSDVKFVNFLAWNIFSEIF